MSDKDKDAIKTEDADILVEVDVDEIDTIKNVDVVKKPSKNRKKTLVTAAIITSICIGAYGVNSYLDHRHAVFLEEYANAVQDIINHNAAGYNKAFEIFNNLNESGEATSSDYYYLGYLYQDKKEYAKAYNFYKKSIKLNPRDYKPYYSLSTLYMSGHGVNKNTSKGLDSLIKSYNLGNKKALADISKTLDNNQNMIGHIDPNILYALYIAYKTGELTPENKDSIDTYFAISLGREYPPAQIDKIHELVNSNTDYYETLTYLETFTDSENPTVSELSQKEMVIIKQKIKDRKEEMRLKTIAMEKDRILKFQQRAEYLKEQSKIGLTTPRNKIEHLNGLVYLNMLDTDAKYLNTFYKDIIDANLDMQLIKTQDDKFAKHYINKMIDMASFRHYNSSMWFDFGYNQNKNRHEGIAFLLLNNSKLNNNYILNTILKNQVKQSSFNMSPIEYISDKKIESSKLKQKKTTKKKDVIKLSHQEQIQRLQIFAQKGDYKALYELEHKANDCDVYAIYYMGEFYYNEKNYKEALKYYKDAASKNYGPAYYTLASLYYNEDKNGVHYNKKLAMEYFKKASDLGVRNSKQILMLIK